MAEALPDVRKKSPLELDKLALYTNAEKKEDKAARLVWSVIFNHPRITIYTNKKELLNKENEWGRITAKLDIIVAYAILDKLEELINEEEGSRFIVKNFNFPIIDNERASTAVEVNSILVGKDKEGIIWLSIKEEGKPNIKFNLLHSDFHEFFKSDGSAYSKAECSKMVTKAYVDILRRMIPNSYYMEDQLTILNSTPEEKKTMFGSKGGYKHSANKSPSSKPAAMTEDAFPF